VKNREELMRVSRGFWQSRAILTAVELDVFRAIGRGPRRASEVAAKAGSDPRATGLLLDALTGIGLLAKDGDRYSLPEPMRPLLTDGPGGALGMLAHHARLWEAWNGLTSAVRTGRPATRRHGTRRGPEAARAFTLAMRDGARLLAPKVAAELDLSGRKLLLDLGGGPGVYAAEFARRWPDLHVVVVDLPDVVAVARELLRREKDVRSRVTFHAADLDSDPLPSGADAAFISHVIHSEPEKNLARLFGRIHRSLAPKGLLIVRDFFLKDDRVNPPAASLFALNMLVNTDGGRTYTATEVRESLLSAGFATARFRRSKAVPDTGYVLARISHRIARS
jgi:SAM-dependent methyltransferase